MGHFSANSSSHTFLLEFLQFVVVLVDIVVYLGFIDTVVKWNVDVALSHVTDHMICAIRKILHHCNIRVYTEDYIQTSVTLQYNHC